MPNFQKRPYGSIAILCCSAALAWAQSQDYSVMPAKALVVGDPVNAASGAFQARLPLFEFNGPIPFDYALSYQGERSFSTKACHILDTYGFDHNIPMALQYTHAGSIPLQMFAFKDDEEPVFLRAGGTNYNLTGDAPVRYALYGSGTISNGWHYLMDPVEELVYGFEKAVFPDGVYSLLRYITDRNGNRITLTYETPTNKYPRQIADGLGRTLTFEYADISGKPYIATVTDQAGRAYRCAYDGGFLQALGQPDGGTQTFAYAAEGRRLEAITRPAGNTPWRQFYVATNFYSDFGYCVTQQVAADGAATWFSYLKDSAQSERRACEVRPDGFTNLYAHYGTAGRGSLTPKRVTDAVGQSLCFTRDPRNNVGGVTDRLHAVTRILPHAASGWIQSVTNALGQGLVMTFTNRAQWFGNPTNTDGVTFTFYEVTRIDYPDGTLETFDFDDHGNIIRWRNRGGHAYGFGYDAHGLMVAITNPAGGVTTLEYNGNGLPSSVREGDLGAVQMDYDAAFRLAAIRYPDGATNRWWYNAMNQATQFVDGLGRVMAWNYDPNGNPVREISPDQSVFSRAYDAMDRMTGTVDRVGQATRWTYDVMGRVAAIAYPEGLASAAQYDARDQLATLTVAGAAWQYRHDAEGSLATRVSPLGRTWALGRDALGRLLTVTNPLGASVTVTRDVWDAITSYTTPDTQTWTFAYASNDLPNRIVNPNGDAARFTYTPHHLLAELIDLNGQSWRFEWSPIGLLTNYINPLGQATRYDYDVMGRVAAIRFPDGHSVSNAYDAAGQLVRKAYDDGRVSTFTYDYAGRLLTTEGVILQRDAEGRITNNIVNGEAVAITRDGLGRIQRMVYGNSGEVFVDYAYHATNGLLSSMSGNWVGSADFEYDGDGRLLHIQRSNGLATAIAYDAADQIATLRHSNLVSLAWQRDAAGRATALSMDPAPAYTNYLPVGRQQWAYDAAARMTSTGYVYDARGRVTAMAGHTLGWDGAGNLTNLDGGTFGYNGLNDLVSGTAAGQTNILYPCYALPGAPPLAVATEGGGAWIFAWTPAGDLLYAFNTATNQGFYCYFDDLGHTLALSGAGGVKTDEYGYDPYGRRLYHEGANDQPFQFLGAWGGYTVAGGAAVKLGARWYDPAAGRFLVMEPVWPVLDDPRLLNPYQYAFADPVNQADPYGLFPKNNLSLEFKMLEMDYQAAENAREEIERTWAWAMAATKDPAMRAELMKDPDFPQMFRDTFHRVGAARWKALVKRDRIRQFLKKNRQALAKLQRKVDQRLGALRQQQAEFQRQQAARRRALQAQREEAVRRARQTLQQGDYRKARAALNEAQAIDEQKSMRSCFPDQFETDRYEDRNAELQHMRQFE